MCFDISLLFGNKPLFVQLSTNKFGRLLTAHQHTAKDRPHAETTTHPIGSHTRNEQSRIDFLRIFYGCRLTQLDIQRTFADPAPSRSIQLDRFCEPPRVRFHSRGRFLPGQPWT